MSGYFITGGSGFLGKAVLASLLKQGASPPSITVMARSQSEALQSLGVRHVQASILDRKALEESLADAEFVYHLAGWVSRNPNDAEALWDIHVVGTDNVMKASLAAGVKRVVLASSSGTVGCFRSPREVATDDSPFCEAVANRWPYNRTKIEAEKRAMAFGKEHDVEVISLNPSLILGPGDERGSSTGDVRKFLARQVPVVPQGGLNFVDVRDLGPVFARAATHGEAGTRYLLGTDNLTLDAFFVRLESVSGVKRPKMRVPAVLERLGARVMEGGLRRLGMEPPVDLASVEMAQHYWYIDSSRAKRDLDFAPRPMDETLRDTVEAIRAE